MIRHADSLLLVWKLAELEARHLEDGEIKPAHFFLGLLKIVDTDVIKLVEVWQEEGRDSVDQLSNDISALRSLFKDCLVDTTMLRRRLRRRLRRGIKQVQGRLRRNDQSRVLFQKAETSSGGIVRPLDLFVAILEADIPEVTTLLADSGVDRERLSNTATKLLEAVRMETPKLQLPRQRGRGTVVEIFGRDLTRLAKTGELEPIIGRKDEMRRLAQVLLQSRKNNVILTGEAGVGKTGIVEGFAQRIIAGKVPAELRSMRLVEISMTALVAGTTFRGDFEARIQALVREAAADRKLVLFIDEIHLLIGAGQSGHATMDAANILKPALSRGEIRVIGATTTSEYRRFIESDPALERRFQRIEVHEPSRDDARKILQELQTRFEKHHNVTVCPDALDAAVELSIRYVPDRRLPDKAIDLIDQACAQARLRSLSSIRNAPEVYVDAAVVAEVVSRTYGVPLAKITGAEKRELLRIEEHLRERVKGQDDALVAVADVLRLAKSGLRNILKPLGIFLLAGPTGSGKTELAKAVAEFLFGDENHMLRLDMSEFVEEHSVSKLIGSPPGYRDHEQGGQLTERIRSNPYTVVLLDEVEKAHPKVLDIFLQLFDEGVLTDSRGQKCNFRETVIFLTSNLGAADAPTRQIGFGDKSSEAPSQRASTLAAIKKSFRPEFINRLSQIIVFQSLDKITVRQIADKFIDRLKAQLTTQGVSIVLDDSAYELLINRGFNESYGAREMERTIDTLLAKPLAKALLEEKIGPGVTLKVSAGSGQISFLPAA